MRYFIVKRKFKWVDELPVFQPGEVIGIEDRHPRLDALLRGKLIVIEYVKSQDELKIIYDEEIKKKIGATQIPLVVVE